MRHVRHVNFAVGNGIGAQNAFAADGEINFVNNRRVYCIDGNRFAVGKRKSLPNGVIALPLGDLRRLYSAVENGIGYFKAFFVRGKGYDVIYQLVFGADGDFSALRQIVALPFTAVAVLFGNGGLVYSDVLRRVGYRIFKAFRNKHNYIFNFLGRCFGRNIGLGLRVGRLCRVVRFGGRGRLLHIAVAVFSVAACVWRDRGLCFATVGLRHIVVNGQLVHNRTGRASAARGNRCNAYG